MSAGARTGRVTIDGARGSYPAEILPYRWNGWTVATFDRATVAEIAADVADDASQLVGWEGDTLVIYSDETGEVDHITPDERGRYVFDGWTWSETDEDDDA